MENSEIVMSYVLTYNGEAATERVMDFPINHSLRQFAQSKLEIALFGAPKGSSASLTFYINGIELWGLSRKVDEDL